MTYENSPANWTPEQRAHVEGIIAYWRAPRQRMREALSKAREAKKWNVTYAVYREGRPRVIISGYHLNIGEAIWWRCKMA